MAFIDFKSQGGKAGEFVDFNAPPEKPSASVGGLVKTAMSSALDTVGSAFQGGGELLAAGLNKAGGTEFFRTENPAKLVTDPIRNSMSRGDKAATEDTFRGDITDWSSIELPKTAAGWAHAIAGGFGSLSSMILPGAFVATGARGAMAAGAVTGALTTGGAAAEEVRSNVKQVLEQQDHDTLMQNVPAYRLAIAAGMDPGTAKQKVENDSALLATGIAGAFGAAGGAFNAKVLEDIVAKRGLSMLLGKSAETTAGRVAVGAGVGTVAEGLQEGLEKVGQNVGENIGLGRPTFEQATRDTAGDVIIGGMIGAATGGAAGAITRPAERAAKQHEADTAAIVTGITQAGSVDQAIAAAATESPLFFDRFGALEALDRAAGTVGGSSLQGESLPYDYTTRQTMYPALPAPDMETGRPIMVNDGEFTRQEQFQDADTARNFIQGQRERAQFDRDYGKRAPITLDERGRILDIPDEYRPTIVSLPTIQRRHAAEAAHAFEIDPVRTEAVLADPNVGTKEEAAVFKEIINGQQTSTQGTADAGGTQVVGKDTGNAAQSEAKGLEVEFDGKRYPVTSIQEASEKWTQFRQQSDAGVSDVGNGVPVFENGKQVARISYNGRMWDMADNEIGVNPAKEGENSGLSSLPAAEKARLPSANSIQNPEQAPSTGHFSAGEQAFKEGKPRILPSYFTKASGKNAKDWYRGWDAANVAAITPETKQPETVGGQGSPADGENKQKEVSLNERAINRLQQVHDALGTGLKGVVSGAAADIRGVIGEMRKPRTAADIKGSLERASERLYAKHKPLAEVIDSIVEELYPSAQDGDGQQDELPAEMRAYEDKAEAEAKKQALAEEIAKIKATKKADPKPAEQAKNDDAAFDESDLNEPAGRDGWRAIGYVDGNDNISYPVHFRDISSSDGDAASAIRQIRIYDDNGMSYMAAWEWQERGFTEGALADLRVSQAIFHYSLSNVTDEAFGDIASDGDALWAKYGRGITNSVNEAVGDRGDRAAKKPTPAEDIELTVQSLRPGAKPETIKVKADPAKSAEQMRAEADLMSGLADLADIFGKNTKLNMMDPEQEQKLLPILTKVFDAAFRLGHIKFKQAAKFVLDTIRAKLGADIADALTLEHLQGAYIGMSGRYKAQGAEGIAAVSGVADKAAIENSAEEAQNVDEGQKTTDKEADDDSTTSGPTPSLDPTLDAGAAGSPGPINARGAIRRPSKRRSDDAGVLGQGGLFDAGSDAPQSVGDGSGLAGVRNSPDASVAGNRGAVPSHDYRPSLGDLERQGSWFDTAARNIDIIDLARAIDAEKRIATPEEQAKLAKYVGFGASEIRNALFPVPPEYLRKSDPDRLIWPDLVRDAKWKPLAERIDALPRDWQQSILQSTQYAHYTSGNVVASIWRAVERLGFNGGKVLEPGMGIGTFNMLIPSGMKDATKYTGIEFDAPTALIAKLLSPDQNMLHDDFIKRMLPKNFFDLAIGNPPFAKTKIIADPEYAAQRFSLHDYFFAKSIDRVRPGGLLVFVTSHYTMDKQSDRARKYLSERADLLGAIRLPSTAFGDNAGTSVVTDVLFLRKRAPGDVPAGAKWNDVTTIKTKDGDAQINTYFAEHPEMVLGQQRLSGKRDDEGRYISGLRGVQEYTVVSYDKTAAQLDEKFGKAVEGLPQNVYSVMSQPAPQIRAEVAKIDFDPTIRREGVIYKSKDGDLMRVTQGVGVPIAEQLKLTPKEKAWFDGYIGIRDMVQASRAAQFNDGDWEAALKSLNKTYDKFRKEHGPILDYRTITRTTTDEDGNEVQSVSRIFKNKRLYREDYDAPLVAQLEIINEEGDIIKAPFLLGRTVGKPVSRDVKTPGDALAVSLNEIGSLDIDDIAARVNMTRPEIIEALGESIFEAPDGKWQMADEYLSGNVVKKLAEANEAAKVDKRFERNVDALQKAQPEHLGPSKIFPRLGAGWIPQDVVIDFAKEIEAGAPTYDPKTESWQVVGGNLRSERRAGLEYGTAQRSPSELLEAVLNSRPVQIRRTLDKGKTEPDKEATVAAQVVMDKMQAKFKTWVWQDAERAQTLVELYNRDMNNIAGRRFDGSHLTLPGVSLRFKLFPHQLRAIWRIIQTGNTYLSHAVGAGKTIEMIAAGMEQKRLGLIKKPMYVVPNHMLEQFSNEFMELYPLANIMVADDENFSAERRRHFVAAATLNNPDAIIITHSSFERIGVKEDSVAPIREAMIDSLREQLDEVAQDSSQRVRRAQLEQQIEAVNQRFDSILNTKGKDATIKFEDIGADFVIVDEAHIFRKLDFATNQKIKGIDANGSRRALDLYVKTRYLESKNPGRSLVMASGTPITNTMGELYTIMKFFDQGDMEPNGISTFDGWARTFGEAVVSLEPNAVGQYEQITRFAKFVNLTSVMARVREFMDVLTSDQLGGIVKRPEITGGKPRLLLTKNGPALKDYIDNVLKPRLEISKKWKPSPQQKGNPDPIIKIIGDARFAALDPRFFGVQPSAENPSRLNDMADNIIADHNALANVEFTDRNGKPEPIKGATQIVFYNLGFGEQSQRNRGFNAKHALTKRLVDGGIPRNQIAWFDDADTDVKKENIFKAMRSGTIRVLIGSAKKMGTGVNVQKRLAKLHYFDPPWYPADLTQPHGRIIRQGNQNAEGGIDWYATEASFDSQMWGTVSRKQKFIDQAFSGDKDLHSMEDLSEANLFEQAAAVASGDPRALKLAGLRQDVERLQMMRSAHEGEQNAIRYTLQSKRNYVERVDAEIKRLAEASEAMGGYAMFRNGRVDGLPYTKAGEFGAALKATFNNAAPKLENKELATIETGISVKMAAQLDRTKVPTGTYDLFMRVGKESRYLANNIYKMGEDVDDAGLTRRIINAANQIPKDLEDARRNLNEAKTDIARLVKKVGAPFDSEQELFEKYAELKQFEEELGAAPGTAAPGEPTWTDTLWGEMAASDMAEEGYDAPMASRGNSRPADRMGDYTFVVGEEPNLLPIFGNKYIGLNKARLGFALGLPKGTKAVAFDIVDRTQRNEKGKSIRVGEVLVHMRDGKFVSLRNIQIDKEFRQKGNGHGEAVIASMLQHNGDTPMEVWDIQHYEQPEGYDALPFWKKIGTKMIIPPMGPDSIIEGFLSRNLYLKARQNQSRIDANGNDTATQEGDASGTGGTPLVRQSGETDGEPDARRSGSTRQGFGLTRQAVREELTQAFGTRGIANLERDGILWIGNYADAPKSLTSKLQGNEEGAYWNGRGYIFADNLAAGQAPSVLLHEVGEHFGLGEMLGPDGYARVIKQVQGLKDAGNPAIVAAWNHVKRHYDDAEGSTRFMHEVIAKAGQDGKVQQMSWWKKLMASLKAFLIRTGFKEVSGQADLEALLYAGLQKAMHGESQVVPIMAGALAAVQRGMKQSETAAFKRWFGASKVVDENGKPLAVYHGTGAEEDFKAFDTRRDPVTDDGFLGAGTYFSTSKIDASDYAETSADKLMPFGKSGIDNARVMPAYLSIKNPFVTNSSNDTYGMSREQVLAWTDARIAEGYDGATNAARTEWVAFEPTQIKSATGNNGNYDPKNPSILASRSEESAIALNEADFRKKVLDLSINFPGVVEPVWTGGDLPDSVKRGAEKAGVPLSEIAGYITGSGKIYIVGDRHRNVQSVEGTIFHELYAHYGLRNLFGKQMYANLNALYLRIGPDNFLAMARKYDLDLTEQGYGGTARRQAENNPVHQERAGGKNELRRAILMDELLAHISENERDSWAMRAKALIGEFRQWLRDHGFASLAEYGETDLAYLLKTARTSVVSESDGEGAFARLSDQLKGMNRKAADGLFQGEPALEEGKKADKRGQWYSDASDDQQNTLDRWEDERSGASNFKNLDIRAARESLYDSASAHFNDYEVAKGLFEIPISDIGPLDGYSNAKDTARIDNLAAQIKESGEIEPLFVALDANGSAYLMEGQHRARALQKLGYTDVPARVVVDMDHYKDAPMASRGNSTPRDMWDLVKSAETPAQARDMALEMLDDPNQLSLWDKTLGTQLNKARKNKYFRKVFDVLQRQQDDVAAFAIEAEAEAVDVLARMGDSKEIASSLKASLSGQRAKDLDVVSKAIFSKIAGVEGVNQKVYTDEELAGEFGMNERQIGMYRQSRDAIDRSLDRYAQSVAVKIAQQYVGTDDLRRSTLDDSVDALGDRLRARIEALESMVDEDPGEILRSLTIDERGETRQNYVRVKPEEANDALTDEIKGLKAAIKKIEDLQEQAQNLKDSGYAPAMRFGNYSVTARSYDPRTGEYTVEYFGMSDTKTGANVTKMMLKKDHPGWEFVVSPVDKESFKLFRGISPDTVELFARFMDVEQDAAFKEYIALATSSRSAMKRMLERKGVAGFSDNLPRVLSAFITSNSRAAAENMNGIDINEALEEIPQSQGDVSAEAAKLVDYLRNPTDDGAKIRGFMFAYFMGGSVASAIVNLTQPVMMTAPFLSQFAGLKTGKIVAKAGKMAATGKVEGRDLKAAFDRAEAEGVTDAHEYHQLMQEAEGGGSVVGRAAMKAWGSMFGAAEKFNRRTTFLAAFEVGQGMTREQLRTAGYENAYDFAKGAVAETQGIYNKANRPNWARTHWGALLLTFKQFSIAYLEFFNRLPMQQKMLALGLLVLAAGLEGLPFAEDLEDLIDTIGQKLGYATNSKKALRKAAVSMLGEAGAEFALRGLSGLSGVPMDVSGRLGMGNLVPGTRLFNPSAQDKGREMAEVLGAAGGVAQKAMSAVDQGKVREAMPKAMSDAAKAFEMMTTGEYRDSKGRKVITTGPVDAAMKLIGFQPRDVADASRKIGEQMRDSDTVKRVESEIVDQWADGVRNKKPEQVQEARERLKKWNEDNPDLPIRIKFTQVANRIKFANMTRDQRFQKTLTPEMRSQILRERLAA